MRFSDGFTPVKLKVTDPFYPRFWPGRFNELPKIRKPSGIFTCDMSDLFGIGIPEEWTRLTIEAIKRHPEHRFYLLTKQPQNLPQWSPYPCNCWVGVTATGTTIYWNALAELQYIEASVKYVSLEPLLEPIKPLLSSLDYSLKKAGIGWVIIGACTGRGAEIMKLWQRYPELTPMPYGKIWTAQPRIEWVEEIVVAADKAGIPVFLKDNLRPLLTTKDAPWAYIEVPQGDHPNCEFELEYRQEMQENTRKEVIK
ncbi:hypothetical protein ES708_32939 [subsurface metagenome]